MFYNQMNICLWSKMFNKFYGFFFVLFCLFLCGKKAIANINRIYYKIDIDRLVFNYWWTNLKLIILHNYSLYIWFIHMMSIHDFFFFLQ